MENTTPYQQFMPHVQRPRVRGKHSIPPGSFAGAHHFSLPNAVLNDISYYSENFMKTFAEYTIKGAAFDSSDRRRPPRCHPGTRLAILERANKFFANHERDNRLLWLVGPAGVGKSAIMQTLAEAAPTPDFVLGASLFFSINGRDDGSKTFTTLAYEVAVKFPDYQEFIQGEVTNDPTLPERSFATQFNKFFVEPFVTHGIHPEGHRHFLILIDGLDECKDRDVQCEILDLISSFCIKYPASPLLWVVASRPEPHITHFLSLPNIVLSYTKEEIKIDTDESREEVERYLRNELENVRTKYRALALFPRWPAEREFLKIATAAGGLFHYGSAVVKFINDPNYANPISQLQQVLEDIDGTHSRLKGERHPMVDLDALYGRVLSRIPPGILESTKKLLLWLIDYDGDNELPLICNWLGMTPGEVYGCLDHLNSVLDIPSMEEARDYGVDFRHRSFRDYLVEFKRSGMFQDLKHETDELNAQCLVRILREVPEVQPANTVDPSSSLSLSWEPYLDVEECQGDRRDLYSVAIASVIEFFDYMLAHHRLDLFHALKVIDLRFCAKYNWSSFINLDLPRWLFAESLRSELNGSHILREMPIGTFDLSCINGDPWDLIICCQTQGSAESVSPYQRWCKAKHYNQGGPAGRDGWWEWQRLFCISAQCGCTRHVLRELEYHKKHSPNHPATTFVDVTGSYGWVFYEFIDQKDGLSLWRYIIPYCFNPTMG